VTHDHRDHHDDRLPFDADVEEDASGAQRRDRFSPKVIAAVAFGGALGAPARYGVSRLIPPHPGVFPWATFWTNVSGSLALGFLLVCILERFPPTRYVRPFVATGFLGAYTTFSTFAVDGDLLVRDGHVALALTYWVASIAVGVLAAVAGMALARRVRPRVAA
jgi:fluoride exporter